MLALTAVFTDTLQCAWNSMSNQKDVRAFPPLQREQNYIKIVNKRLSIIYIYIFKIQKCFSDISLMLPICRNILLHTHQTDQKALIIFFFSFKPHIYTSFQLMKLYCIEIPFFLIFFIIQVLIKSICSIIKLVL